MYYGLVYSALSYIIMLWGNSTEVNRVFILKKPILRLIFRTAPRSSCRRAFFENEILTLASIFIYRCQVYVEENE